MGKTIAKLWKCKLIFLFGMSIMVMFVYPTPTGYACSCAVSQTVEDEMQRSSAVFSGRVIEITDVNKFKVSKSSGDPMAVLFEVNKSWKGVSQSQVIVHTVRSEATCGYEFQENEDYLVYTEENEGKLTTSICSRTTPLVLAQADLDQLGEGEQPTEKVNFRDASDGESMYIIWLVVGLAVIVGIFLIKRFRRHWRQ